MPMYYNDCRPVNIDAERRHDMATARMMEQYCPHCGAPADWQQRRHNPIERRLEPGQGSLEATDRRLSTARAERECADQLYWLGFEARRWVHHCSDLVVE